MHKWRIKLAVIHVYSLFIVLAEAVNRVYQSIGPKQQKNKRQAGVVSPGIEYSDFYGGTMFSARGRRIRLQTK